MDEMTHDQFLITFERIKYGNASVLDYILALMYVNSNPNVTENQLHKKQILKLFALRARYKFYNDNSDNYDVLSDFEKEVIKAVIGGCDIDSFIAFNQSKVNLRN
jgi:hypothetical protein